MTPPPGALPDSTHDRKHASEPDPASLTYETARDELVDIVRRLESGNLTLEESLRLWERGEALAVRCQEWLAGARATIDRARQSQDDARPSAG